MKDIEKVHKEVGEYNQKQIDKFIELYIEIKERYIDYKVLKNIIL
jgi:N-acetyl-anhydromuramyl-L-alanine amidase AmpD